MSVRYDMVSVPDWISSKFVMDANGKLTGRAPCTNIGVFTYKKADGGLVRELRLPEEVFAPQSMESLKNIPVTLGHVNELTPQNMDEIVGRTGTNPIIGDNIYLSIDMEIEKEEAINAIKNGTQFLSCAYTCDLEPSSGRWLGMDYDAIQRNIRYGHVAIVDNPRAGETAKIKLDSDDAIMDANKKEEYMAESDKATDMGEIKKTVKEIMDEHNAQLVEMQKKLDEMTQEKTKLEAERDSYKDKITVLEKKIADMENVKMDESIIMQKVNKRIKIIEAAKSVGVELKEDMSEIDMEKAIITKIFPKANLDGKDAIYIDARFDSALEVYEMQNDAQNRIVNTPVDEPTDDILKKAKEKYLARLLKKEE